MKKVQGVRRKLPSQESGVQNQIEREAQRLRLGVRGGVALDPIHRPPFD